MQVVSAVLLDTEWLRCCLCCRERESSSAIMAPLMREGGEEVECMKTGHVRTEKRSFSTSSEMCLL